MNRVQPIAIASEPLHGWRLSKNQSNTRLVRIWKSKTASRGVESIESWRTRCIMDLSSGPDYPLNPPQIHHARNQGERRIEETHYIVDGYDASTRTVHEIHGCFWYGLRPATRTEHKNIWCVQKQLVIYFNPFLSKFLSAYRKGYSCESVLLHLIEDWKGALDKNSVVGTMIMDLSKTCDLIPHDLFLATLSGYGISTHSLNLLKSCLTNSRQQVRVEDVTSDTSYFPKAQF